MDIAFNKPYYTGKELKYIQEVMNSGKSSGDGIFTKKCHSFFKEKFGFRETFMTTSCTDALELSALLMDIGPGDEVILPSYTFVSTANPFLLRGARLVFADSSSKNPNLDIDSLEGLISARTKAIILVHYAGIACDMDVVKAICDKHGIYLIEDAAQGIDAYYKGQPLGGIGDIGAYSFHDTKNITSGEGGMIIINNDKFAHRAEIIREKGTNRASFFRGEVDKYGWVDIGSSFLPSDFTAAVLYAQLEALDKIQDKRKTLWLRYQQGLRPLEEKGLVQLPYLPSFATNNGHIFYIVCKTGKERKQLIRFLGEHGVKAVFHYLSLHKSVYFKDRHDGRELVNADIYTDRLLRLPLFYELEPSSVDRVIALIQDFYAKA